VLAQANVSIVQLKTNASDRAAYLRHPNLGRTLDSNSARLLHSMPSHLAIVIADGLSALAVERNVIPLLSHLLPQLIAAKWTLAPLTLVQQARVAIGDPIGHALGTSLSLVLIGERPGLSSPDSLGAYITWKPQPDRTDADRNCISNIREGGLAPDAAAARLLWYLETARTCQLTGTALKERSLRLALPLSQDRNLS
jgi:ethanolamine ammonia-lyase small subunit